MPYTFQATSEGDKTLVKELMAAVENRTCIRFQEITGQGLSHHLLIKTGSESCFGPNPLPKKEAEAPGAPGAPKCPPLNKTLMEFGAKNKTDIPKWEGPRFRGTAGSWRSQVVLASDYMLADREECRDKSRSGLLHELFHVFGVMHTQTRADRDRYVTLKPENITPSGSWQYRICSNCDDLGVPYDCDSIMHYSSRSFSCRPDTPTMVAKNTTTCDLSHGAGHYQRHGARLAAESDWVLLARVADRLCGGEGWSQQVETSVKKPFTAFA